MPTLLFTNVSHSKEYSKNTTNTEQKQVKTSVLSRKTISKRQKK